MKRSERISTWGLVLIAGMLVASPGFGASPLVIVDGEQVRDAKTGLTWHRASSPTPFSWAEATNYCAQSKVGTAVWRLPNIRELQSIVDDVAKRTARYAIDTKVFSWTKAKDMDSDLDEWSSTPVTGKSSQAWYVKFEYGSAMPENVTERHYVRCVR